MHISHVLATAQKFDNCALLKISLVKLVDFTAKK